jgi:signal-transduction protein with cAMP-binding, CBS, and nucleotidyltransferase domain
MVTNQTGNGCEAVVTNPDATITAAAKLMREHDVGAIFVMECPGEAACSLIGAVTDRDLVVEVIATGLDSNTITVGDLVKNGLTSEKHTQRSRDLVHVMCAKGVTHVPIASDGQLCGTLRIEELVRIVGE